MMQSSSYQGQDLFVVRASGGKRAGYFIDSGASNGVRGNNTKLLESEFGWNGICIEPNDSLFAELVRNRSCICLDCCLYNAEGPVEFLEAAHVYGGIVREYEANHFAFARRFAAQVNADESQGQVPTVWKRGRTIRSVLQECGAPRVIDYWSLDTEGSELAILRSFPFDEYRFHLLTVEHNYGPAREAIREFLETRGYRRVTSLGIDDCYVWAGRETGRAWRSDAFVHRRRPAAILPAR